VFVDSIVFVDGILSAKGLDVCLDVWKGLNALVDAFVDGFVDVWKGVALCVP